MRTVVTHLPVQAVINVTKSLETPKSSTMASTTQPVPLQHSLAVSHLSAKRAAVMLPPYLGTNQVCAELEVALGKGG